MSDEGLSEFRLVLSIELFRCEELGFCTSLRFGRNDNAGERELVVSADPAQAGWEESFLTAGLKTVISRPQTSREAET